MLDYLLEVGTEELPASFLTQVLPQWAERIPRALAEQGLTGSTYHFWATPRRLSLLILDLPPAQPDRVETVKGPAVANAYDQGGNPTKALLGFARSKGVAVADLQTQTTEKGDFVFAQVAIPGQSVGTVLQALVPGWITGLEGKRLMRWGAGSLRFSRPIRWLVSLLGTEILPITLEGVTSDRTSYGHRVLAPGTLTLTGARDYEAQLRAAFVWVNPEPRRIQIQNQLQTAARTLQAQPEIPADLLDEVNYLVEWPTVVTGQFEADFLTLPPPVIKTEMTSHQRYFPVHQPGQPTQLLPNFLSVSNGDPEYGELIAQGNSRVLRARLWDARFFYKEDRKQPLAAFLTNLKTVTFQEQLGSVAQRVERIVALARFLSQQLGDTAQETSLVERTAQLCKADLTTQMVKEFPELQGVMGYYYATADGEDPLVCLGIEEHYLPRFAGDLLPTTRTGTIVALAERAELVGSLFLIGQVPTGSSDPFGLRRATLGLIQLILKNQLPLSLQTILAEVYRLHGQPLPAVLKSFYKQRLHGYFVEQGLAYDLVNAVLEPALDQPQEPDLPDIWNRVQLLQRLRQEGVLARIYETVNRVIRLGGQANLLTTALSPQAWVQPALFQEPAEQRLFTLLKDFVPAQAARDYELLVAYIHASVEPVSEFFVAVLVMTEDEPLRVNRLNLLGVLRNQYRLLADFSQVVMEG